VHDATEALDHGSHALLDLAESGAQLLRVGRVAGRCRLHGQDAHQLALLARRRRGILPRRRLLLLVHRCRRRRALDAEQAPVERLNRGSRRRAELVSQQDAQPLVGAQRLGHVAVRGECLHEEPVGRLGEGRGLDGRQRGAHRARELGSAQLDPRRGDGLE